MQTAAVWAHSQPHVAFACDEGSIIPFFNCYQIIDNGNKCFICLGEMNSSSGGKNADSLYESYRSKDLNWEIEIEIKTINN